MKKPYWLRKRLAKRLLACAMAVACATTVLPAGSFVVNAAETTELVPAPSIVRNSGSNNIWVNGSDYSESNSMDAIKWRYNGAKDKYYLYLPSSVDLKKVTIWHTFSNSMYINGTKIESGATTDIFNGGGTFTVKSGSKSYTLRVYHSTNINTMFITTKSGSLDNVNASTTHSVSDSGNVVYVDEKGNAQKVGLEKIKGRGNSSWEAAQKLFYKYPYSLKFDEKVSLYGMGKSKKWNLLANDFDQSLIRNKFVYDLAKDAGLQYTPDCEFADVYQNGRYIGNYQVTSKVEVASKRVNVTDLEEATELVNSKSLDSYSKSATSSGVTPGSYKYVNIPNDPEDITGGYLLQYELDERYGKEFCGFVSSKRQPVVLKGPEYASQKQVKYIRNYYQKMEDAIYASNGKNSEGKYYTEYLDLRSAAQMYIIEELTMEVDAVATSFYMYKDVDGKMHFGPSWDFDWSMGNYSKYNLTDYTYKYVKNKNIYNATDTSYKTDKTILGALCKHDDFMKEVVKVWKEDFYPLLKVSTGATPAYTKNVKSISAYGSLLTPSATMNFSRFDYILGSAYWGSAMTGTTYADNINQLKAFVKNRTAFLNDYFNSFNYNYDDGKDMIIYYDNSETKWDKVYAYVYSNLIPAKAIKGTLVEGTDNIYQFTISDANTKVVFKNTAGTTSWDQQTADASVPANTSNKNCFVTNNGENKTEGTWATLESRLPREEETMTAFQYNNTDKVAGEDVNEYTDGTDTYTYLATKGNGTMTGTITGEAPKHLSWSSDEYVTTDGSVAGIVPAFGASKTNPWSANAAVTISVSTENYEKLTFGFAIGATKKGPANYAVYVTDGQNKTKLGTYSLAANKTLYEVSFAVPTAYENKKNVQFILALEDTTAVNGSDLSVAPTGGEFVINDIVLNGTKMSDTPVTTAPATTMPAATVPATTVPATTMPATTVPATTAPATTMPATTAPVTATPTVEPISNMLTLYYKKTSWSQVYCHYKVNGVWTKVPGVAMDATTEQSGYQWKIVLDLGDTTEATVCFTNGSGSWDSNSGKNYTIPAGTYGVKDKVISKLTPVTPATTAPATTAPVTTTPATTAPATTAPATTAPVTATPDIAKNQVVVYYTRSASTSWTNAYIHYKVNGVWTKAPGVKMTKISAGKWKYTIDLGNTTSATFCFNNGSGSWDNNNGSNYTVGTGSYEVKENKVSKVTE